MSTKWIGDMSGTWFRQVSGLPEAQADSQTAVASAQIAPGDDFVPCSNPECPNTVKPFQGGKKKKRACSDRCRAAAWALAHPRWPKRPGPREKLVHLKPSAMAVLGRLLQGPATTHDLLNLEYLDRHGNMKRGMVDYRSRASELRRAGYNVVMTRLSESSSVYCLVQE